MYKFCMVMALFVVSLLVYATVSFAAVTGTVTDTKSAPVVGATVTFTDETNANNKFSGSTDVKGKYAINIAGTTGVDAFMPSEFSLGQNYPNPFNPTTTIPFTLDSPGLVSIAVYNVMGQKVATVIENYMSAGSHFVTWNGMDDRGNHVSAGIYLYQLRAGRHTETKKMLLLDGGGGSYVAKPSINSDTQSAAKIAAQATYTIAITQSGIIPYKKTGVTITDGQTMDFVVTLTGEVNWPANVLAATTLNSPVLAALASKYGQTSQATLNSLSTGDLEQAVRASFAVGIDLSAMTATSTAANPVIQMALRIGVPIVCENKAALTAYLSRLLGLPGGSSTADIEAAAAAMTAAIGLGVQSQIAVVMPSSVSADLIRVTEIFSLGAGSEQPVLPTGTLNVGTGSPAVITDINKLLLPSKGAPPLTGPAELLTMIESAISQRLSQRSVARVSAAQATKMAAATKPAAVTQKEFLIKYPEYVWYPRDRGQDFIIQCSIRAQLFQGSGGTKKWLRLIVDDGGNTSGFLNRGDLVFTDNHDKGYFMSGVQVKLSTTAGWVAFGGRNPGHLHAGIAPDGPNDSNLSDYNPGPATSATSFAVDYVEGGVKKTWNSEESRQFQMDEFELNPESGADWRWSLYLCETPDHHDHYVSKIRKLGYASTKDPGTEYYSWEYMAQDVGDGHDTINNQHTETVGWPLKMSRGTDQYSLHPKVQAYYSVPANETRTAQFTMNLNQEVWNLWSTEHDNEFRAAYSSGIDRNFKVDFNKMSASTAIWATNTWGNPGATRTLQADGNLVIKSKDGTKVLWASNTGGNSGLFCLKMQDDGNLVIYRRSALWSSGTSNNSGATLKMQDDGNLVITSKDGRQIWWSNTYGNPGAYKTMQGDGNLVILSKDGTKVLWAAGTGSNPGAYDVMQDDGNYVIYKDGAALWSSRTDGNPGAYDVMQSDGNYVIYTKD